MDPVAPASIFGHEVAEYTSTHNKIILPLQRKLAMAEKREEEDRRRREAEFPLSISQYNSIRNKDVQLRIARFLTADSATQNRMMDKYGWAWRQTEPLQNDYKHNVGLGSKLLFRCCISRDVIDHRLFLIRHRKLSRLRCRQG